MRVNSSSNQVKFFLSAILFLSLTMGLAIPTKAIQAATSPTVVYDAIPNPLPPNMASQPFQAQQTFEYGDYIHLAGTNRVLRTVTVTMSDWAVHSDYLSDLRYSPTSATWSHLITLNIYNVIPALPLNQRGSLLASVTQTVSIPWRPETDPTCGIDEKWRASDGTCYGGLAFNATFDLGSLNVTLPNDIIVAVAYNTQSWGASPIGSDGPYNSLNVGADGTTVIGTDDNSDRSFWNTITAAWYADGGAAGVGIFREDTGWGEYGTTSLQVTAAPAPDIVYVDKTWGAVLSGQDPDGTGPATDMGYDAFTTIQAGVNAVASGGNVNVAAGTYDEQVILNKGLTLAGAGDTTIIRPSQTTATSFTRLNRVSGGAPNSASILATNTTANVTVRDLKIDGSQVTGTPSGAAFMGILYRGTPGLIDSVTVQGIAIANGNGMYLSGFGSAVSVTVSDSNILGYNKNGITANNPGITANISGNTITGMGPTTTIAQNGIQIGQGATGHVNNNTISANAWTATYGGSNDPATDVEADGASGVLLYLPGAGVEIDHNTLSGNQMGIWSVAAPNVNIHDNVITGLAHTANVYPTGIAIWSKDMWTGGFGGTETATTAIIANNTISTNDYGVLIRDYTAGGVVPTGTVSGNTFNNNSTQVLATGNSIFDTATTFADNTFDRAVTVNHLGALLHAIWGKIQLAVGSAVAGDTVNVAAGTYVDNVIVDKALTIVGAGAASTIVQPAVSNPNPCTGSSLCGGASNVFLIQASNVTIHDLAVDGDNPGLTSSFNRGGANLDARNGIIKNIDATYNNLEIYNVSVRNIYLRGIYSTGGSFNFHHNNVTNVQGDGYSIAMFAWYGPGIMANNTVSYANDAISANHSNGIQFLNNIITHSGSGIHTDNSGDGGGVADLIQGNTVSDCSTDGYGIWTFVPYLAPVINNNTITNCSVGLSAWGQGASVIPQFTNNTVTGPDKAAGSVGAYITTDQIGYGYEDISVLFTGNVIANFETGIYLTADAQSWTPGWVSKTINATFHLNQISGNTKGLDKGTTGTYTTDFEKNWWGAASGPGPVGFGLGDTVSANVDYSPWCTNPVCTTFAPPLTTTTTITADSPDPSVPGQTVSVTATVEWLPDSVLTPTGTVIVLEGVASGMSARSVGTYCTITLVGGTGSCDLTFLSSGAKTITAVYTPENTADFIASSDTEGHTVNKITSQVTTWPTASSINYGQALVASILSGGSATPAGSFAITTPAAVPGAGSNLQSVTFTPADTANYSSVTSTVSVTVNKVALSVTANNASQAYNGLPYSGGNGVVYSGFVNGDTSASLGGSLAYSGTSQAAINVGNYSIVPAGLTSGNYTITFHNGTLTINKASQTITFAALVHKDLSDADFTVSASAGSGLPVSFSTTTSTVCNVTTEGLVHLVTAGTCTIQANQSGDDNYNAAALVQRSFTVGTITYNLYLPVIFNY